MKQLNMSEKIRILIAIIRETRKNNSQGMMISLINLSARAEVSLRKKDSEINSELEIEINTVIQNYKTNNSLTKTKAK